MTKMYLTYLDHLDCELVHEDSGVKIFTTAPKDNGGTGQNFSPTDLFAASLGSCVLTLMGIAAKKYHLDIKGTTAEVEKEMVLAPVRRVGKIIVKVNVPVGIQVDKREVLEKAASTCPVKQSLHPDIIVDLKFFYA